MKHLLNTILFFSVINLYASVKPITGVVLDAETKEPLAFANIAVEGTNKGTVSNIEGHFVLNMEGIDANNLVLFSYMGYKTLKISVAELKSKTKVYLQPATVNLQSVPVLSRSLTAREILKLIEQNYEKNYPTSSNKQRIFFHKYEKSLFFNNENNLTVKKTNFVGMDKTTFNDLMKKMPKEFIDYQDAIVDLYNNGKESRLIPVEGISLEEGSQQVLAKEFENKMKTLFSDIQKSMKDKKLYYKFRSGIFSKKIGHKGKVDSIWNEDIWDDKNYHIKTDEVKTNVTNLLKKYSTIDSRNWEFITKPRKYNYKLKEITTFNDDLVYEIAFTPQSNGLFKGRMFVSTTTFAVLRLDFAFETGKQSEKFHALGIGHSTNYRKGTVIFEKGDTGYYAKYIYAQQKESVSVDRNISIMKKKKQLLFDKSVNKIKIKTDLDFNVNSYQELLVLEREGVENQAIEKIKQPQRMKFRIEFAYTPEMWQNRTVIAPTSELKKYKRKE
jgi:hypothetical protein